MSGNRALAGAAALVASTAPASSSQLIVVRASAYHATVATLTAYAIDGGLAYVALGPWTARLGYNGFAPHGRKREGDGRTPSGTFDFRFVFGIEPNPGVLFPYRPIGRHDFWDDDPASPLYDEWVDSRRRSPGRNPEPMHRRPAYDYGVVIAYNVARVPGRGSAVFLHVDVGGPTGGCVTLPHGELLAVLRWLDPTDQPRIELGVRAPAPPLGPTGPSGASGATGVSALAAVSLSVGARSSRGARRWSARAGSAPLAARGRRNSQSGDRGQPGAPPAVDALGRAGADRDAAAVGAD